MDPEIRNADVEAAAIAAGEEALQPHDRATEEAVRAQMATLHRRDQAMAWGFVVALLIVIPFTVIAVWDFMPSSGVRLVVVVSAAIVLIYNVASMLALVRNYARDRDFIYRRDVAHLRERAALKALGGEQ